MKKSSVWIGLILILLARVSFGQNPGTTPYSTPAGSEQVRSSAISPNMSGDSNTGPEADAPKTIYSRSGVEKETDTNPYGEGRARGKINFGKKKEQMIVTAPSKANPIRKTKDGSSDATEPTGVFKGSLLDSSIDGPSVLNSKVENEGQPSATPHPRPKPSASPTPSAVPKELSAPTLDLSLGVSTPRPTATPDR